MYTDPDKLLPQHGHLLLVDPVHLGEGPLTDKQVWISRIEVLRGSMVETVTPDMSAPGSNPSQDTSFTGGSPCNHVFVTSLVSKVNCAQNG